MAKTVFANGSKVYAAWVNAIQNLNFVADPQNDGEYPLITDAMLSGVAGNLKPQWQGFRDALLVSAGTGLAITWQGGSTFLPNNTIATIAPSTGNVTASATSFVFVNSSGVVTIAPALALTCLPLAQVVAGASTISSITDLRPRFRVEPRPSALKVFGGFGDQGDFTLSGAATFDQGEYYYNNFTVESSGTLTISGAARIYVAGTCTINGTINVSTTAKGGVGRSLGANGYFPSVPGNGVGAGVVAFGGSSYQYYTSAIGSSGSSGEANVTGSGAGTGPGGGDAGGSLTIEAAGAIVVATGGSILVRGSNGVAGAISTTQGSVGGGGGGSGGSIILRSLTSINIQGGSTLDVRGGNGSNALGAGAGTSVGGGGGGGGIIALLSPSNTNNGTIILTAGTGGSPYNNGGTAVPGGGGGGFGGAGGNHGAAGTIGLLIVRNFAPVG